MVANLMDKFHNNLKNYAMASDEDREAYSEYVKECHSDINEFVSEFNFTEWVEAGKPTGKQ